MFDRSRQDFVLAMRALRRSPVFVLTAVLSLAVGIGATTAIVTLANTLLLRPAPGVGAPERLVTIGSRRGGAFDNFEYPTFVDLRASSRTVPEMAAMLIEPRSFSLAGPSGGEPVQGSIVSGNFFRVLRVRPAAGRFFAPDEDLVPRARPVVVLSHAFWRRRFGSDSSIVGRTVTLNGTPFTVVGVAPERFRGPFVLAPDMWAPVMSAPLLGLPEELITNRRASWLVAIGRLAQNAGIDEAQAELTGLAHGLKSTYPDMYDREFAVRVSPASVLPGQARTVIGGFIGLLFAIASLVLAVACMNVAGMLLARATVRRREIAVRLAIGATRARLVRHLLTESLLLFAAAGVAGVLLARVMVDGALSLLPRLPVQLSFDAELDWRVLLFALSTALVSGVLAGLVPALQTSRPALVPALKSDTAGGGSRSRLRGGLLVAQIAFSMLLLVTAGLFGRALVHARSMDPGFDPRDVSYATIDLRLANLDSARGNALVSQLLARTRALPGVERAATSAMLPVGGGALGLGGFQVPGRNPPERGRDSWDADWNVVSPGYFDVLRTPLVAGRDFTDADRAGAPDVAIINETLAARVWPEGGAVGRTFRNDGRTVTVIGIARNAKYRSLGEEPRGFVYVPIAQRYFERASIVVRTAPGVRVDAPLRRVVAELAPALPVLDQRTMQEHTAISLLPQRIAAWVAGSLGGVALLLALIGIYGVTAYSVAQSTREIGVRVALGATRGRVLGLVLRQGVGLATIGVTIGAVAALGVTRLLAGLLYGVHPLDALAFVGAGLLLVGAALAASWVPSRRAAAVEPMTALRME
jgi:predicted permease